MAEDISCILGKCKNGYQQKKRIMDEVKSMKRGEEEEEEGNKNKKDFDPNDKNGVIIML